MKVAFFSYMPLSYGGGFEQYLMSTSEGLRRRFPDLDISIVTCNLALAKKVHFWHGLYFGQLPGSESLANVGSEEIRSKLGPRVRYIQVARFKELRGILQSFDAIYSKNELIEAFMLKYLVDYAKLPPIIFGCHTPVYYPGVQGPGAKIHNVLYTGVAYRKLASGVRQFHVLNKSDESALRNAFPHKKVSLIPNPFDFDDFVERASAAQYDLALDPAQCHILWVGRLTAQKGLEELANIIHSVNVKMGDAVSWTIVGDGPSREKLEKLKNSWANVHILGYVEPRLMPSVYRQHDVLIGTSKWESFGLTLLEAQAFGLPVVGFDIAGYGSIIRTGENGYLVKNREEFAAQLEQLIQKSTLSRDSVRTYIRQKLGHDQIYASIHDMLIGAQGRYSAGSGARP